MEIIAAYKAHMKANPGKQRMYTPYGFFEAGWNERAEADHHLLVAALRALPDATRLRALSEWMAIVGHHDDVAPDDRAIAGDLKVWADMIDTVLSDPRAVALLAAAKESTA